jgi:DNA invertase Pin-like site-specific DNA recombinase
MATRAVIYLRVFPHEQSTEAQRGELEAIARQVGWRIVGIYEDEGVLTAKDNHHRPALDRLLLESLQRRFDVVMAWSIDRLGPSLPRLLETLAYFHRAKFDLYLLQQGIDTTTPHGRELLRMVEVFTEFERGISRERVLANLERARTAGRHVGRPKANPRLAFAIRALLAEGFSLKEAAALHKIGIGTVRRLMSDHSETSPSEVVADVA